MIVHAGAGNDAMIGGDKLDGLWGGGGNDILIGGANNDVLVGEAGNDFLLGGIGSTPTSSTQETATTPFLIPMVRVSST